MQSVNYLTCWLWTVSGYSDHTTLLPNFTGWAAPAALTAVLGNTALFLENVENNGTQWCYLSSRAVSLSFVIHCSVEKCNGRMRKHTLEIGDWTERSMTSNYLMDKSPSLISLLYLLHFQIHFPNHALIHLITSFCRKQSKVNNNCTIHVYFGKKKRFN